MSATDKLPLKQRIALVTGAGKGLGRASALALARAGADVALVSRTKQELDAVAAEIRASGRLAISLPGDMTRSEQADAVVEAAVAEFGSIDVLVHCVGRSLRKQILDYSDADWREMIATNLDSAFFVCRAVGRQMRAQGRGVIVNVASAAGLRGRPNNAPYSSSKAAVINLSRALALEWAPYGIRVNILAPGRFLTPLTSEEMSDPQKYAAYIQNVPLRRIGQPEELDEIVTWLASDASGFVTGALIVIDGGQTLQ